MAVKSRCATVLVLGVLTLSWGAGVQSTAQPGRSTNLHVKETAGIWRFFYPVNARMPFPRGELTDAAGVKLRLDEMEIPAQYTVESRWPDGSVQWLAIDFNTSIGPAEMQTYRLEFGQAVTVQNDPHGG